MGPLGQPWRSLEALASKAPCTGAQPGFLPNEILTLSWKKGQTLATVINTIQPTLYMNFAQPHVGIEKKRKIRTATTYNFTIFSTKQNS